MFRGFTLLPSSSPPDGRTQTSSASGNDLKLPRKTLQPVTPTKERSGLDHSNNSRSTNASVQSGSSESGLQGGEQCVLPEDKECGQAVCSAPETINYDLESDAESEVKETDHTVTRVTATTTTQVEERQTVNVQKSEQSTATREPRQQLSSTLPRTTVGQQQYGTQFPAQGGATQKKLSFYQETYTPKNTETFSSTSTVLEPRHSLTPQKSTYSSAREHLLQIERLHREERDRIIALMTGEYEDYKYFCEERFEVLKTENESLKREITILQIQLNSGDGHPGKAPDDKVHSNITTITTSITTVTSTLTTVTTRIERWKRTTPNNGQITISVKEVDQLSSDLSNTSSRMAELQQRYIELSGDFRSVRDDKDRTISSLTAGVAQWKDADAAARRDNESLRRDLLAASGRTSELQQRYDVQSNELASTHNELQTRMSIIEEKDRMVSSFTVEVARWKQSDITKAEQIASLRRDNEKLQSELTASSSKSVELQNRCDAYSKELGSVRSELRAKNSLLEEKERTITTLTATVDQWERADTTKAEQIAAAHGHKEKLQLALESFSSQTADLQKRYETQSKEIVSVRNELQAKVSMLEETEHVVSSLTAEVTQGKHEGGMKVEQLATAQRDIEQLRLQLSTASTEKAALQKRCEALLKELNFLRDELHQIEVLYPDGADQAPVKPSEHAVSQHIASALEKKNKQMEELRRDLDVSTTRNAELQRSNEALSGEVSVVRNEFKVKTSQDQGTITSLSAQIEQWKRADTAKAERIATLLGQVEKLRQDISTSTSQLTELRNGFEKQSRELITVRNDLQNGKSSNEGKDRTIATLTAEIDQRKRGDVKKTEEIAAALKQTEKLQAEWSASSVELAALKNRHETQSRELTSVRVDLQTHVDTISSLTAERDQLKSADAEKAEQITTTIKHVQELEENLFVSTSQFAKLEGQYEAQSCELESLRSELQTIRSSNEEKDRAFVVLTAQMEEGKRTVTLKEELIVTIRKEAEDLRLQFTNSSSQLAQLKQRYDMQSKQLTSLQDQVRDKVSGKDRAISSLHSQVEEWKHSDAAKAKELTTVRTDIEKLRHDLATSASQIIELQKRDKTRSTELSSEIETWKRSDATKTGELTAARKDLDQLRRDLSSSSSQIVEYRQRCVAQAAQSAELASQVEQWKGSDAAKAKELTTARTDIEQFRRYVATSSSQIIELQKRDKTRSAEFSSEIETWKHSDATKTEELTAARKDLDQLRRDLSSSSSQIVEYRQRCAAQSAQSAELASQVEQWKGSDTAKAKELTTARTDIEKLRRDLATSSSQIIELQKRVETRSTELSLQIENWKRSDVTKTEELTAARKDLDQLRQDLSNSSSQIIEYRQRCEAQSAQSAELISRVEQWKVSDAAKAKELTTARTDIEQLRRDLATSSSQIIEFEQRCEVQSTELTSFREQLELSLRAVTTLKEQLQRSLSVPSSQTEELQNSHSEKPLLLHQQQVVEPPKPENRTSTIILQVEKIQQNLTSQLAELQGYDGTQSTKLTSLREQLELSLGTIATLNEQLQRRDFEQLPALYQQHSTEQLNPVGGRTLGTITQIEKIQQQPTKLQGCYEAQSAEFISLREQLELSCRTVATLNDQLHQLKRENAVQTEELAQAHKDLEHLRCRLSASSSQIDDGHSTLVSEESQELYESISTEVKDYAAVIKLTAMADQWLRADTNRTEDLELELQKRKKENEELQRHLMTLKGIYIRAPELKQIFQSQTIETQRRYEEQSKELRSQLDGVERFVTTADVYADEVIVQILRKLNAEVQQNVTFMAECILVDFRPGAARPTKEQTSAVQRVSVSIGQILAGCLLRKDVDDVALYLPIALQAYITYWLRLVISSWTTERGYNDLLNKTYEQLQKSEAQTVSGRWRSLTRAYISPSSMSAPSNLVSFIVSGLSDIIVAAGCAPSTSAAQSKVSTKFGEKVSSIITIAGQFHKMIGEVVSADFEVLAFSPTLAFDEATMEEDADDDEKVEDGTGEKVLCSTQLGMTKRMELETGKKNTLTVIKTKVVLESFLDG